MRSLQLVLSLGRDHQGVSLLVLWDNLCRENLEWQLRGLFLPGYVCGTPFQSYLLLQHDGQGLGCLPGQSFYFRPLTPRERNVQQLEGIEIHQTGVGVSQTIFAIELWAFFGATVIAYLRNWGNEINSVNSGGSVNHPLGRTEWCDHGSSVHDGQEERDHRLSQLVLLGSRFVVVSEWKGIQGPAKEASEGRFFCHFSTKSFPITSLQLPIPCLWEWMWCCMLEIICKSMPFPPICHGEKCPQQVEDVNWGRDDPNHRRSGSWTFCTCLWNFHRLLCQKDLLCQPTSVIFIAISDASADCMKTLQQFARHQVFFMAAAWQLSLSEWMPTRVNYQCKWKI